MTDSYGRPYNYVEYGPWLPLSSTEGLPTRTANTSRTAHHSSFAKKTTFFINSVPLTEATWNNTKDVKGYRKEWTTRQAIV